MLREENARQGFFEHADFEHLVANLPEPINGIARFGYLSGWRRGEIVGDLRLCRVSGMLAVCGLHRPMRAVHAAPVRLPFHGAPGSLAGALTSRPAGRFSTTPCD